MTCLDRRVPRDASGGHATVRQPVARRGYLLHAPKAPGNLSGYLVVLWHGAGGDVDHPTLVHTARAFSVAGAHAVRARFPYRVEGRKAPDRMPKTPRFGAVAPRPIDRVLSAVRRATDPRGAFDGRPNGVAADRRRSACRRSSPAQLSTPSRRQAGPPARRPSSRHFVPNSVPPGRPRRDGRSRPSATRGRPHERPRADRSVRKRRTTA